jgi:curved DNA-binding protein CbpA
MMLKDHYKKLGVIQEAEDIVIKAAYRALAQRYHPDKWTGDPATATRYMSEINSAYRVLSNPEKRKQYDKGRSSNEYDESEGDVGEAEPEFNFGNSLDDDWKEAVKYFPDLNQLLANLARISIPLAQTYKVYLLENKEFLKRKSIATHFERRYIQKYFGTDYQAIKFATFLINQGARGAAKDLNRAINLLGNNVSTKFIIERVLQDYPNIAKLYQPQPQKTYKPSDSARPLPIRKYNSFAQYFGLSLVFVAIVSLTLFTLL